MKNYRITVNGNTYDVQVEEVAGGAAPVASAPVASTPVAAPTAAPAPTAPAAQAASGTGAGQSVTSPMPGSILDIKVSVGDKVSANQVVAVLEAMKMENEIVTPVAGTVTGVNVTKGQQVASGDVLVTVAE
jgi:biotin carboxyl carrier protein